MKPLFASGLVDEIALREKASAILLDSKGALSIDDLQRIRREEGIETATMVLHVWLTEHKHSTFFNTLSAMPVEIESSPSEVKLLIVPGMFHKEFPELGGDGQFIKKIAQRFGIQATVVPTASTGGMQDNAAMVADQIKNDEGQKIWIVSISKGSAETGLCLNTLDDAYSKHIQGWISLCGIFKGSPVADARLNSALNRSILKCYTKLIGANYQAIDEMRTGHPWWSHDLTSQSVEMIHVQPIPLAGYVHAKLISRYQQLAVLGPNDGTIMLDDLITRSGHVYPLWGVDHFFRDRAVTPLIYKLCRYVKNHNTQRKVTHDFTENRYRRERTGTSLYGDIH